MQLMINIPQEIMDMYKGQKYMDMRLFLGDMKISVSTVTNPYFKILDTHIVTEHDNELKSNNNQ